MLRDIPHTGWKDNSSNDPRPTKLVETLSALLRIQSLGKHWQRFKTCPRGHLLAFSDGETCGSKAKAKRTRMSGRIMLRLRTREVRMTCVKVSGALLLLVFPRLRSLSAADDLNEQCLMCHEDQSLKDQGGRSVFVKKELVENSIHGRSGLSCVSCHADLETAKDFPHAEKLAKVNCASCHGETQKQFDTSVHAGAKVGTETQAVSCVSCHGYHDVVESKEVRSKTHPLNQPETCGTCHFSRVNGKEARALCRTLCRAPTVWRSARADWRTAPPAPPATAHTL